MTRMRRRLRAMLLRHVRARCVCQVVSGGMTAFEPFRYLCCCEHGKWLHGWWLPNNQLVTGLSCSNATSLH